jgi:hypothetical protein
MNDTTDTQAIPLSLEVLKPEPALPDIVNEVELTAEQKRKLKAEEMQARIDAKMHAPKNLKGARGHKKSKGITAVWMHLRGPDEPAFRVLYMPQTKPANPKNEQSKIDAAKLKRLRKNEKRIRDAFHGGWDMPLQAYINIASAGDQFAGVDGKEEFKFLPRRA